MTLIKFGNLNLHELSKYLATHTGVYNAISNAISNYSDLYSNRADFVTDHYIKKFFKQ